MHNRNFIPDMEFRDVLKLPGATRAMLRKYAGAGFLQDVRQINPENHQVTAFQSWQGYSLGMP